MYKQLILASQSPRRRELMALCEIPFTIINSQVDETLNPDLSLGDAVADLAYRKALAVFVKHPDSVVIGADTIVVIDDEILGKPVEVNVAIDMLRKLSGRVHNVITGVSIIGPGYSESFFSETAVEFFQLSEDQIKKYVESKVAMDKAGAYGIQDKGALFIKGIVGDYYTVMGLPIARVYQSLQKYL
jgi:septum formation protein